MKTYRDILQEYLGQNGHLTEKEGFYNFTPHNADGQYTLEELAEDCVLFRTGTRFITVVPYSLLIFTGRG